MHRRASPASLTGAIFGFVFFLQLHVSQCQNCFRVEFYTADPSGTDPALNCFESNTDSNMRISVQGFGVVPCTFQELGDDERDCRIEVCNQAQLVVSLVPGSSPLYNNWIFQTEIEGDLVAPKVPCITQFQGGDTSKCSCGQSLSVLDEDFSNLGALPFSGQNMQVIYDFPTGNGGGANNNATLSPTALNNNLQAGQAELIAGVSSLVLLTVAAIVAVRWRRSQRQKQEAILNDDVVTAKYFSPSKTTQEKNGGEKNFRDFIESVAFTGALKNLPKRSEMDIKSYKTRITPADKNRLTFLKTQSSRYSAVTTDHVILSMRSTDSAVSRLSSTLYGTANQVIAQVCKRVEARDDGKSVRQDKFSAADVPEMSLGFYLHHLVKSLDSWFYDDPGAMRGVGIRSLLISLVYLEKIKQRVPKFTLTIFNQHRMFAITMLIAAKFTEDAIISNVFWSDVTGIEFEDLNYLEGEFCTSCGFELYVSDEQVEAVYKQFGLQRIA